MKQILSLGFFLLLFSFYSFSQTGNQVLATADGFKFTPADFPADIEKAFNSYPEQLAETRRNLLDEQISETLIAAEAGERNLSTEKLLEIEVAQKVADPNEEQIKNIYQANRDSIGDKTLEEVRHQIVAFLRREPQQKAYTELLTRLKAKFKVIVGKDVNAPGLKNTDVLATVGAKKITVADFDARNRIKLSDFEGNFYDQVRDQLEEVVFNSLVVKEARTQDLTASEFIAREITDKLTDFSDQERRQLEKALTSRLFNKYHVKVLYREPEPFVQQISTDDDPSRGNPNAPVTVVMFSDFQCPACSAVHPVLKKVMAEFGDKIRFVVRDFPLENVHENAFRAALAANAANVQGKFFDYAEILYENQDDLGDASLKKFAAQLGLNIEQFELDLGNEKFADEIRKDIADGKRYGVTGTPTIFINGVKVRRLSEESFRKSIERALSR